MSVISSATLIPPYGGALVDLQAPAAIRADLIAHAHRLRSIQLSPRALCDLELLAAGALSPLDRFMGSADYARVLGEMRLRDGTLFPLPVTLTAGQAEVHLDEEVALRDPRNNLLGIMRIDEGFVWDREAEARHLAGTMDSRHPLVAEMRRRGDTCIAGALRVIDLPTARDFVHLRRGPAPVRAELQLMGRPNVVAFLARGLIHRGQEEFIKHAAADVDASVLIQAAAGLVRPGDVDHFGRIRAHKVLIDHYFDAQHTVLNLLPLAPRFGGPREAIWHAIILRNYGASHVIVEQDRIAPDHESRDALSSTRALIEETGVQMIPLGAFAYQTERGGSIELGEAQASAPGTAISEEAMRDAYLARGRALPKWFVRPEVAEILASHHPPRARQGFCIWFTGLSGAGKSTIAEAVVAQLLEHGRQSTLLDGDVVRTHLSKGLGFSREDRDTNILRIGFVASEIVRHNGAVVCAAISPFRSARDAVRRMIEDLGTERFVEVFVATPIEVCEARDVKGMYAKARRGEITGFTGVDDPYEPPLDPELVLDTTAEAPETCAARIIAHLAERGFLTLARIARSDDLSRHPIARDQPGGD